MASIVRTAEPQVVWSTCRAGAAVVRTPSASRNGSSNRRRLPPGAGAPERPRGSRTDLRDASLHPSVPRGTDGTADRAGEPLPSGSGPAKMRAAARASVSRDAPRI